MTEMFIWPRESVVRNTCGQTMTELHAHPRGHCGGVLRRLPCAGQQHRFARHGRRFRSDHRVTSVSGLGVPVAKQDPKALGAVSGSFSLLETVREVPDL